MSLESYIRALPKVELHVHLEGSIRPETLLKLAERNRVALPASDVAGLQRWYTFVDFPHFIEIYTAIATCLGTPEDIELIAREFLIGQAAQNIRHSEVTYTAYTQYRRCGIPFRDQLDAINRARRWAERELSGSAFSFRRRPVGTLVAERVARVLVARHPARGDGIVVQERICASARGAFDVTRGSQKPLVRLPGSASRMEFDPFRISE